MQFKSSLVTGTLIKRYKRFFADVELDDGTIVTAHCPNTGAMTGCAEPGYKVWLTSNNDPKRKLKYSWEVAIDGSGQFIGINTHNANKLVEESLIQGKIAEFASWPEVKREVKYGQEKSKIDFLLSCEEQRCYVEVKSVTLLQDGVGMFPDTQTQRGQKHLRELMAIAEQGFSAAILFCVQHTGIKQVKVADQLDPIYAELMLQAIDAGVEVLAYSCDFSETGIVLSHKVPFICD